MSKLKVTENIGFCKSVERAIQIALSCHSDNGSIFTYGPIAHNKNVTDLLEEKGIKVIENLYEVQKGDTVVISAHGAPKFIYENAREKGKTVLSNSDSLIILLLLYATGKQFLFSGLDRK